MIKKLYIYQSFTSSASWISSFVMPLIILNLSSSALLTSFSYGVAIIPYIIVSPISGGLGDLLNKKKFLLSVEVIYMMSSLILIMALLSDKQFVVYIILFVQLLMSTVSATQHPIFQSIIPDIVDKSKIAIVNSTISSIDNTIFLIGPALVGFLLLFFNYTGIAIISTVLSLFSFLSLYKIDYTPNIIENLNIKNLFNKINNSYNFVTSNKSFFGIVILFFVQNFSSTLISAGIIFHFNNYFGLGDSKISYIYIIFGLGGIIGSYSSRFILRNVENHRLVIYFCTICCLVLYGLITIFNKNLIVFILLWTSVMTINMIIVVTFFTYRQKTTPSNILSGVIGLTRSISYMAIPFATLLTGYLESKTGSIGLSSMCGFVFLLTFLIILLIKKKYYN